MEICENYCVYGLYVYRNGMTFIIMCEFEFAAFFLFCCVYKFFLSVSILVLLFYVTQKS